MSAGPATGHLVAPSSGRRPRPFSISALFIGVWLVGAPSSADARTLVVYGTSEATFRVDENFPSRSGPTMAPASTRSSSLPAPPKLARLRSSPGTLGLDATHPLAERGPFLAPDEPLPDAARAEVRAAGLHVHDATPGRRRVLDWLEERIMIPAGVGPSQARPMFLREGMQTVSD
jgi:hypothetical protein